MKIDLSYLREMSGGNQDLVVEMITIFRNQVIEFDRDMNRLLQEKKYEELGKLAHKAKSSVAIMGLNELALRLKDLENAAREGKNMETYGAIVQFFVDETSEAAKELDLVVQNIDLYF